MSIQLSAEQLFQKTFGVSPSYFFQAPGRVNLIGEHTDYNDGFVMPCAIDFQTGVAAQERAGDRIRVVSTNVDGVSEFSLAHAIELDEATPWSNYVRGVAWALQQRDVQLKGANLAIAGNIPIGAGLSSSGSLEVAIGLALTHLSQVSIPLKTIASIAQQAENEFVGMRCGIMDQFIAALGHQDCALLIDCRSLEYQQVPIPSDLSVVIVNSHVKHQLLGSEYNVRRQQCEAAAQFFGVQALRDVTIEQFNQHRSQLDPMIAKRARHVITENARTLAAAEALKVGDLNHLGQLMLASHDSMRNDFEITIPEIDALVEMIAPLLEGVGGVRMTGGGFGGCVVALVPQQKVDVVHTTVMKKYPMATGLHPSIYVCHASAGAGMIRNPSKLPYS